MADHRQGGGIFAGPWCGQGLQKALPSAGAQGRGPGLRCPALVLSLTGAGERGGGVCGGTQPPPPRQQLPSALCAKPPRAMDQTCAQHPPSGLERC